MLQSLGPGDRISAGSRCDVCLQSGQFGAQRRRSGGICTVGQFGVHGQAVTTSQRPKPSGTVTRTRPGQSAADGGTRAPSPLVYVIAGLLIALFSAALVLLRGRPSIETDSGIFLSVAGRLVHGGNALYSGVWDNKPPLFYYGQALALIVAGWRGPYLLDVVWLSIAMGSMGLLLKALRAPAWICVLGMVTYPVLLTGAWYFAGLSELPPLALTPLIAWLWLTERPLWVGAMLGLMVVMRPDYAPLYAAIIVTPSVLGASRKLWRPGAVVRVISATVVVTGSCAALLGLRGELSGYVDTLRAQTGYPNRALVSLGYPTGIVGHARLVAHQLLNNHTRTAFFVVATLLVLVSCALAFRHKRSATKSNSIDGRPNSDGIGAAHGDVRALLWLTITTTAVVGIIFALEALWSHSLEPLALPATFGTCLLARSLTLDGPIRVQIRLAVAGGTAACLIGFGGILPSSVLTSGPTEPISAWWHPPTSVSANALNRAATGLTGSRVSYARIGQNFDDAQGEFVTARLKLACPIFQQYYFSTNLRQAFSCLQIRRPQLILVGPSFSPDPHPDPGVWNGFYASSEQLLHSDYTALITEADDGGTIQVWRRRGG